MSDVLRSLANDLLAALGPGRCLVAIDGVDGSGKTEFASSLAAVIAESRPAAVIHMDDFLNPAAVRHARGRSSAEGFWLDSYDYRTFTRVVVEPLRAGGDGRYVPVAFDVNADNQVSAVPELAPPDAVLVVEGLFLHRDELCDLWSASVFLDVPFHETAARMAERDGSPSDPEHPSLQRYWGGQLIYFSVAHPWQRATYVVDNSDFRAPRLIEPLEAFAFRATRASVVSDERWSSSASASSSVERRVLLQTERLTLRQFTFDDVENLVLLDSDPEVMHFITGGLPTPQAEIENDVLPAWLRHYESSPTTGFWAAEERSSGEVVGWFHLRPGEGHPPEEPELGYRLRREFWGSGLATEGSRALVDLAFMEGGATRVLAETMVVHAASRRVMEKVGMRVVREFHADWPYRIPGDEWGDVEYAIERVEWESRDRSA